MDFMTKFIDYLKSLDLKLLPVLMIVMLLDIITGSLGALLEKNFKSTAFREGLFKKLLEVVVVIIGYLIDYILTVNYIGTSCMVMIVGMEVYSILFENISNYISLPDWLKKIVESLKNGEVHD